MVFLLHHTEMKLKGNVILGKLEGMLQKYEGQLLLHRSLMQIYKYQTEILLNEIDEISEELKRKTVLRFLKIIGFQIDNEPFLAIVEHILYVIRHLIDTKTLHLIVEKEELLRELTLCLSHTIERVLYVRSAKNIVHLEVRIVQLALESIELAKEEGNVVYFMLQDDELGKKVQEVFVQQEDEKLTSIFC